MSTEKSYAGRVSGEQNDARAKRYVQLVTAQRDLGTALIELQALHLLEFRIGDPLDEELTATLDDAIAAGTHAHVIIAAAIEFALSQVPQEGGPCPVCRTVLPSPEPRQGAEEPRQGAEDPSDG